MFLGTTTAPGANGAAGDPDRRNGAVEFPASAGAPLVRRLFALVAAVALPLLALLAWAVATSQHGIRVQAEQALLARLRTITLGIEREFDRAEALLSALSASAALTRADLSEFEEEMRAVSTAHGGAPVTLVGSDGTILISTLWPVGERRPGLQAPEEAQRIAAEGHARVTNLFQAPLTGVLSVAVGVPLNAAERRDGPRPAALGLSFPRQRIASALRSATAFPLGAGATGWTASVLDRDGVPVAATLFEDDGPGRPAPPEVLAQLARADEGILHDLTAPGGVPVVTAFLRGPVSGYAFVLTVPLAEFTAPLQSALVRTLGVGGLVLAFGLGLAAWLARRTVGAFEEVGRASARTGPPAPTGLREADELGRALAAAGAERIRAEAALRASEERLRLALDAAALGAWEVDLRKGVVRRSPRTLEIFGFEGEPEEGPYPSWRGRIHAEDRPRVLEPIEAALAGQIESYRVEFRFLRPDRRWIWVESRGRVVERDPVSGAALRIAGTSQDVTERRAAQERQALLMRELDHRAKNALAVVQAAVRLTPKEDAVAYARAVEGRIQALARAHSLLAEGRWVGADLQRLAQGELAPFLVAQGAGPCGQAAAPRVQLEGPPVRLGPATAQGISMVLHELATNATKHGALSAPGGEVGLSWSVEQEREFLLLKWQERGGPPVLAPPRRRGFGSRVIEITVRSQLGGRLEQRWEPTGLVVEIETPLARTGGEADLDPRGDAAMAPLG